MAHLRATVEGFVGVVTKYLIRPYAAPSAAATNEAVVVDVAYGDVKLVVAADASVDDEGVVGAVVEGLAVGASALKHQYCPDYPNVSS